jgi:hypothetical protein
VQSLSHLIMLFAVTVLALVCSETKILTGMMHAGSTARAYYRSVPPSCCKRFTSFGDKAELSCLSSTYCVLAPYTGGFHWCDACSGRVGTEC